jgi:hypothetical protein
MSESLSCNGLCMCKCSHSFIHSSLIALQQIVNCFNEWELGYEVKTAFTGERYESVHQAFIGLIGELEADEYHGTKLKVLLKNIAMDGRSVDFFLPPYFADSCSQVTKPQEEREGSWLQDNPGLILFSHTIFLFSNPNPRSFSLSHILSLFL